MYYYIEPEVAGGWGESTIADTSCHPPKVEKLEYKFDGWLGDDILETFPCFIVTETLAKSIFDSKLTGISYKPVKVSMSVDILENDNLILPKFEWMQVDGIRGKDDFYLSKDNRLVVSGPALKLLQKFNLNHADISPVI
ncbi:hypothetical protein [Pseudomonas viridiflava]|uniref:hypothetical protein n=1 Tax=Pseudomonas viridiflava TaxID=33069 RepID=UPI000F01D7E2|nr:hypothetical protein [Pseudomonas viridiflava]